LFFFHEIYYVIDCNFHSYIYIISIEKNI
jgi:hypothetical protein